MREDDELVEAVLSDATEVADEVVLTEVVRLTRCTDSSERDVRFRHDEIQAGLRLSRSAL